MRKQNKDKTISMSYLSNTFELAQVMDAKYVAVLISMEGFEKNEIIINQIENAEDKLEYYKSVYGDDLVHRHSKGIRIVDAVFGDSFSAIEYELLGV